MLPVKEKRQDFATTFNTPNYRYSGLSDSFLVDDIPAAERADRKLVNVTVWTFDLLAQTAVPIASYPVSNNSI